MAPAARRAVGAPRHGAKRLTEVSREACGDHAAAIDVGFDHHHHAHQPGDDAVALRKGLPVGGTAEREFRKHAALGFHAGPQADGLWREGEVQSVTDHGRRTPVRIERSFVCGGVDAPGQSADNPPALLREVAGETAGERGAIRRAVA